MKNVSSPSTAAAVAHPKFAWAHLLPLVVVLAGAAAYWNALSGPFLFDDTVHVLNNERIHRLWPLSHVLSGRRPVVDLTLALNFAAGGNENVTGYHLVNIAVHLLAAVILYGVIRRTLLIAHGRRPGHETPKISACDTRHAAISRTAPWAAFMIAVIWAVHPLQTQSVTYLIQRAEALMGLFYLLTLYCVLRGATLERSRWYVAAVAACALGMGSKAVMVTAPVSVLLYDRFFLAKSFSRALRARWGLYVGLAATWGVLVATGVAKGVIHPSGSRASVGFGYADITPLEYALTQFGVVLHYLRLCLWPRPLCLDYVWPPAAHLSAILLPAVVILFLLGTSLVGALRHAWWSLPALLFFLVLAPTSTFVPIKDVMFEHRLYLPLAAFVALAVTTLWHGVDALASRLDGTSVTRPSVVVAVFAGAVMLLSTGTVARNRDYHDPVTMWRDVTSKRPENARAFEQLGTALVTQGDMDGAIAAYRHVLGLDADDASAYANLGNALLQTRRLREAVDAYRQVLRIDPNHVSAAMNLGNALDLLGRRDEAIEAYRAATNMTPPRPDPQLLARAHANLGSALGNRGNLDAAIDHYRTALRLWPRYDNAHFWWGLILARQGNPREAVAHFRAALEINPNHRGARRALQQTEQRLERRGQP